LISYPPRLNFTDLRPAVLNGLKRFALGGVLPLVVFYALLRLHGPTSGILGGMSISLLLLSFRFRQVRRWDPVVLIPMVIILLQGCLALALNSPELYLAAPAIENFVWGLLLFGSVVLGRPLIQTIAVELNLVPPTHRELAPVRRALRLLTVVWGLAAWTKSVVRVWLLTFLPIEPFLVIITLFHLILNLGLLAFSIWWSLRVVRRWSPPADGAEPSAV